MKNDIFDDLKEISSKKKDLMDALAEISRKNDFDENLKRYANDPAGFIEKYVSFYHSSKGLIKVTLYPHQTELLEAFHVEQFHVVRCARQLGTTSVLASAALHYAYFNSNKTVLMMSYKLVRTLDNLRMVREQYTLLPEYLKQHNPIVVNNKDRITFKNGTTIRAVTAKDGNIRGSTACDFLLVDDFGYLDGHRQDEILTAVIPSIRGNSKAKVVIASSGVGARGLGDYKLNNFVQFWQSAIKGKNMFIPHGYSWDAIPRTENFKGEKIAQLGEKAWKAEYEVVIKDDQKWQEQKTFE